MKRIIIFILLFCLPSALSAQKQGRAYLDSLIHTQQPINDTNQVKLLDTISYLFRTYLPDSGIAYGNRGLKMAETLGWKKGKAWALNSLGVNYKAKTDNPKALEYYLGALSIWEELNDLEWKERTLGNIGNVYWSETKYGKALEYDSLALAICRKLKDKKGIVRNLGNIGAVYDDQKEYKKALKYYSDALAIAIEINFKSEIAKNYGCIAGVYNEDTEDTLGPDNLAKAIEYGNKAIGIYQELGDEYGLAINFGNMGANYLQIAKSKTGKLTADLDSKGNRVEFAHKAIEYFNQGIKYSEIIHNLDAMYQCYQMLAETDSVLGDYRSAYENYKLFTATKDSITNTAKNIAITKLETQRALEVKDRDLKIAALQNKQEKYERVALISGIVLLLVIIIVVVRKFIHSLKSNRQLAIEKKKHLQRIKAQSTVLMDIAYIQSHEVRGPLSTIMGLVGLFNYEDPADPGNVELLEGIATVAGRLDKVITEVVNKENALNHEGDMEHDEDSK